VDNVSSGVRQFDDPLEHLIELPLALHRLRHEEFSIGP